MNYRRSRLAGGTYFFTVVTANRSPVFNHPAAVQCLRTAFRSVKCRHPFIIDAMVVLPDHIHCIWTLPVDDSNYPTPAGHYHNISWLPPELPHRHLAICNHNTLFTQTLSLHVMGLASHGEGNLAIAFDYPVPGNRVSRGEVPQGSAYVSGLAAKACQVGDLAVAGDAAGGDGRDDLPDFLIFGGFDHGLVFALGRVLVVGLSDYGPLGLIRPTGGELSADVGRIRRSRNPTNSQQIESESQCAIHFNHPP